MADSTLARYRGEIENLKRRTAAVRERAARSAAVIQRDAVAVGAAGAYGALRKGGTVPAQVMGLDADLVVTGALYIASHLTSGTASDVMHDAAIGIACAAAYSRTRT